MLCEGVADYFKDGDGLHIGNPARNEGGDQNGQEQIEFEGRADYHNQNTDQLDQGFPSPRMDWGKSR